MTKYLNRIVVLLLAFSLVQEPSATQQALARPAVWRASMASIGPVRAGLVPARNGGRDHYCGRTQGSPLQFPFASQALAPSVPSMRPPHKGIASEISEQNAALIRPTAAPAAEQAEMINEMPYLVAKPLPKSAWAKLMALSGGRTAIIGIHSGIVYVADLRSRKQLRGDIDIGPYASDTAVSFDGNTLTTLVGYSIYIRDIQPHSRNGEIAIGVPGETPMVQVSISNDGQTIVAASKAPSDQRSSKPSAVVIKGKRLSALIYGKKKEKVCLSGDGRKLFTFGDNGKASSWDLPARRIRFDEEPIVIEKVSNSFFPGSLENSGPRLMDMATDERGDRLVTLSEDSTIRIYDPNHAFDKTRPNAALTGEIAVRLPSLQRPLVIGLSPDGRRAATGHNDGTVRIWDLERREQIASFGYEDPDESGRPIRSIVFTTDGLVAAGSESGQWAWIIPALSREEQLLRKKTFDLIRAGRLPFLTASVTLSAMPVRQFLPPVIIEEDISKDMALSVQLLRESASGLTARQLLAELTERQQNRLSVRDETQLNRELARMEGSPPMRRRGNRWLISGIAREWTFTMDVQQWPPDLRQRWVDLGEDTSGKAIGMRIRLTVKMLSRRLGWTEERTWKEIGGIISRQTGAPLNGIHLRKIVADWCAELHEPALEKLESIGAIFGVETIKFRNGRSLAEEEPRSRERAKTSGDPAGRVHESRLLHGRSYETLAQDLRAAGIRLDSRALREFEIGTYRTFIDVRVWRALADALGESVFYILADVETWEEAYPLYSVGGRIQLLQWARGIPTEELAEAAGVNPTTLQHWIEGRYKLKGTYRQRLLAKLNVPESELFASVREGAHGYIRRFWESRSNKRSQLDGSA